MSERLSVSVIIPTYNRADLIEQAIDSLLSQTRVPDEIIVVDDGSTDNTPEVLARYGSSIRVISQSNAERSAARNVGMQAATGDLIALLDSDDTLMPQSIERRAWILETEPDVDVVYSNVEMVDKEGRALGLFTQVLPGTRPSGAAFFEFARHNLMPIHAFMFRRRCLGEVGLFDAAVPGMEDYDFWLRMAARFRFAYLDQPLACYRIHTTMMTAIRRSEALNNELIVHRRIFDMPAFQCLSPQEKSCVYYEHGNRCGVLGRMEEARTWYRRAISVAPTSPRGYVFAALSLLGAAGFRRAITLWMRLRGDLQVFRS